MLVLLATFAVPGVARAQTTAPATRPAAPAPAAAAEELWADGSAELFWIARAAAPSSAAGGKPAEPQTDLYVRARGDPAWQRATPQPLALRITELAHRGPQAVVVLDGGQWMLLTGAGASTGQPLPHAARLLALAGGGSGGETLWALGLLPPAQPRPAATRGASTAPAGAAPGPVMTTRPSAAAAAAAPPASQPAGPDDIAPGPAPRLVLYGLKPAGWAALAALPPGVKPTDEPERFSIAAYEQTHEVYVAARGDDDAVRVLRLGPDRQWQTRARIDPGALPPSRVRGMKLLGLGETSPPGPPVLWLAGAGGQERLYFLPPDNADGDTSDAAAAAAAAAAAPRFTLDLPPAPGATARTAAFANGAIRLVRVVDGKLYEQSVEPRPGAKPTEAKPIALPAAPPGVLVTQWINVVLTVALGFAIIATLLRRRETQQATADAGLRLQLAPLGRRVLAGLVDALPLLVTFVVVLARHGAAAASPSASTPADGQGLSLGDVLAITAGAVVYVLHVAVGELLAGRSLGKWLFGLRVVALDGRPAPAGAVVTRNLLRVIDIAMMFLPLVLVAYSPLRQRPGDVAAGTVVVTNKPTPTGPNDDQPPPPAEDRKSDEPPGNGG